MSVHYRSFGELVDGKPWNYTHNLCVAFGESEVVLEIALARADENDPNREDLVRDLQGIRQAWAAFQARLPKSMRP